MAMTTLSSSLSEDKHMNSTISVPASPTLKLSFTSFPQWCLEIAFLVAHICCSNKCSLFVRPAKSHSFAADLMDKNHL